MPGPPAGSRPATVDFRRAERLLFGAVSTRDSVLFGFGLEQIASRTERAAVLGAALRHLIGQP